MWKRLQFPASTAPAPAAAPQKVSGAVLEKTCCCGDITVRLTGDDWSDGAPRGHLCFCTICTRSTGSHFVHSIEIPLHDPKVTLELEGNRPTSRLSTYRAPGITPGSVSKRFFCARCGDVIGGTAGHEPGIFMLRTGGFDAVPPPAVQYLAAQMVKWLKPTMKGVPDGDEMQTWRVVEDPRQR